jgi:uncharacterized membrane protein
LGEKEFVEADSSLSERPFFLARDIERPIPVLQGFTTTRLFALSDTDVVVGYASRPPGPAGNMSAFIWSAAGESITELPRADTYLSSCAFDISRDGLTVSGYVVGRDPPRMCPCVWTCNQGTWSCRLLSTVREFNPILTGSGVVVSDDGSRIAACLATETGDESLFGNSLFEWTKQPDGSWTRKFLLKRALKLANINNSGVIVGHYSQQGVRHGFVVDSDGKFQTVKPLAGDASVAATDVNNEGIVVGYSDDPAGPTGGPQAIIWKDEVTSAVQFPIPAVFSAAASISDSGQIAGYLIARDGDGTERMSAFILTPASEAKRN